MSEGGGGAPPPLPPEFLKFLEENHLDPSIYTSSHSVPRYIRVKPSCEGCIEELEAEINCKAIEVDWLQGFYSLPHDVQIAGTNVYQKGKIYGMDAASGAAVSALGVSPGDHVLDLCAAPGAKLCMLLDLLGNSGSVTGVDVSQHRLAACRTLVQKYKLGDLCRLFVADGTTFSLPPSRLHLCQAGSSMSDEDLDTFKEWTSRRPWKERKRAAKAILKNVGLRHSGFQNPELIYYGEHSGVVGLTVDQLYRTVAGSEISIHGYDKVLVDAECTHDGSIRHIQKFEHWGWETIQQRVFDAERTEDSLAVLQLKLLRNGFRLLKAGGTLVYITCSLTVAQNEDVVDQFLKENHSAGDRCRQILASQKWKDTDDPALRSRNVSNEWTLCCQKYGGLIFDRRGSMSTDMAFAIKFFQQNNCSLFVTGVSL